MDLFPVLRFLPFGCGKSYRKTKESADNIKHNFFIKQKLTYHPDRRRGIVDEMIAAQQENEELTDENIATTILNISAAGMVTTRATLLSFFLAILQKPDVTEAIQNEINEVIGTTCPPSLRHRQFMPYTEAVIHEVLRLCPAVPIVGFRATTEDVIFRGYNLPKDTLVLPNLYAAHMNETEFPDPFEFKPERWLDEHGERLDANHHARQNLLTFGIGKRLCLGESFAKSRIFLYVTTLLQSFNFAPGEGNLPKLDPREFCTGIVMSPATYQVLLSDRNNETNDI